MEAARVISISMCVIFSKLFIIFLESADLAGYYERDQLGNVSTLETNMNRKTLEIEYCGVPIMYIPEQY